MRIKTGWGIGAACLLTAVTTGCSPDAADTEAATGAYFERIRHDPAKLAEFLEHMPLGGDLHHHASGGIRPAELIRMGADDGLCLPTDPGSVWILRMPPCGDDQRPLVEALDDAAFHREIERRWSMQDYLARDPSIDRIEANDYFFTTFGQSGLARRDFSRVLAEVRALAAREGVIYLETSGGSTPAREARDELISSTLWNDDLAELRSTVLAHPLFAEIVDATVESLPLELDESDRHLGCGGSSPDPGCDVFVRFQRILVRTVDPKIVFVRLLLAYEVAQASPVVVGINFAGPETHPISVRDYELHMRMFGEMAAYYPDVKRTLHAGEMTDELTKALGAERHIALAVAPVEAGGAAAHRIGHATALRADPDPARLLAEMKRRGVAAEINLESNRQLLGVDPLGHPLVDYLAAGVPVALSTDDPGPMYSDMQQQFELAALNENVSYSMLKTLAMNSITYSFLPAADRQRLLGRLGDDFAAFEATRWEISSH